MSDGGEISFGPGENAGQALCGTMTATTPPISLGGAVPGPATWALMIGGLRLAGAALRRRRGAAIAA